MAKDPRTRVNEPGAWPTWKVDGMTVPESRCPQPSPLPDLSELTCKLAVGHEPPHRFTSHGGRADLQQFPTAKELAR